METGAMLSGQFCRWQTTKINNPILMVPCASGQGPSTQLPRVLRSAWKGGREGFVPERNQRNRQRFARGLEPT